MHSTIVRGGKHNPFRTFEGNIYDTKKTTISKETIVHCLLVGGEDTKFNVRTNDGNNRTTQAQHDHSRTSCCAFAFFYGRRSARATSICCVVAISGYPERMHTSSRVVACYDRGIKVYLFLAKTRFLNDGAPCQKIVGRKNMFCMLVLVVCLGNGMFHRAS